MPIELKVNKEVIERVEQKEYGWIVLTFKEPHPILEERMSESNEAER